MYFGNYWEELIENNGYELTYNVGRLWDDEPRYRGKTLHVKERFDNLHEVQERLRDLRAIVESFGGFEADFMVAYQLEPDRPILDILVNESTDEFFTRKAYQREYEQFMERR